ncbi:MAG TPA: DnaJ C-terminal domain-containing protein, partial [Thermoleophilia bacterium]|nr:DnaJ C-terminal domain-containing protein [Thermoleophilia bacterium]
VEESGVFHRRGSDFVIDVPITLAEAALGAMVPVPTPDGKVALKVPAGVRDGTMLRIIGKGSPKLGEGGSGDLLARIAVVTPTDLTEEERGLLEQFATLRGEDPRTGLPGW